MRETFVSLLQWNFSWVPPSTRGVLLTVYGGLCQTAINENAHNVCRDHARDVKHGNLSRVGRFLWPHVEQVFSQFKRNEISPNPTDRCGKRRLPEGAFDSMAGQPTIEDKYLRKILGKTTWHTSTAQTYNLAPAAFQLMLTLYRTKKWQNVDLAWKAVFFLSPMVVKYAPDGSFHIVLDSSQHGLWLWPCERRTIDSMEVVAPATRPEVHPRFQPVFDFDQWQAIKVSPSSPLALRQAGVAPGLPDAIHIVIAEAPRDVLCYAAENAFGSVTDHWLGFLMNLLGVSSECADLTLLGKIDALVRHCLPGITDDDVAKILAKRGASRGQQARKRWSHPCGVAAWMPLTQCVSHQARIFGSRRSRRASGTRRWSKSCWPISLRGITRSQR